MRTELVTDALGMAIIRRQPNKQPGNEQTVLHSDHGCQYQCHLVSVVEGCGIARPAF
jgi:transposase InsO family protein